MAKSVTDTIFDTFSDTLFAELSNSPALSLQGFPGLVMGVCLFLEVMTIIKLFQDGRDLKDILKSVVQLMVIYTLIIWCYGGARSVRSLSDLTGIPVPQIKGVQKGDPIREAHFIMKYGFSKVADGIAIAGTDSGAESQKSVMDQVEIEALGLVACDRETDGRKQDCMKEFKKSKTLKDAEDLYDEKTECGKNSFGIPDFACYGSKYFQVSWFTLILIQVMSYLRVLLFNLVALLYVLTLTITFVAFKMILPFAIWSKKRSEIAKATQDFFSTTLIAFLIKLISYIIGIVILGISSTSIKTDSFVEILIVTILRACMVLLALFMEVVIYFKAPSMALSLFRLNISTLLDIGKAATDALKIAGNLAGLAIGISALGGAMYNSLVPKGIRDIIGQSLFGKTPSSGGGSGDSGGNGGGGGGGSNFASGDESKTNESSGQTDAQSVADEALSQNSNSSTDNSSGSSSNSGSQGSGPSPKSQVDPNEFESMLDEDLKKDSKKSSEAEEPKKSLWEKAKGSYTGAKAATSSAVNAVKNFSPKQAAKNAKDKVVSGVSNTVGSSKWWKETAKAAPANAWGATKAVGGAIGTGVSMAGSGAVAAGKVGLRATGMAITAGTYAYKALSPFASAGMSLLAGDSTKALETMKNAGKGFSEFAEQQSAKAGDNMNEKLYSQNGSKAKTDNEYSEHFEDLKENEAFDTMKDNIDRYEKGIEKADEQLSELNEGDSEYESKKALIEQKKQYFQQNAQKLKAELDIKEAEYSETKKKMYDKYSDLDADKDGRIDDKELIAFLDASDEFKSDSLKKMAKNPTKGSAMSFAKRKRDKALKAVRAMLAKDRSFLGGLSNSTVAFIEKNKDLFGPNALAEINAEANAIKISFKKKAKPEKPKD
jgi:hypothetical protein